MKLAVTAFVLAALLCIAACTGQGSVQGIPASLWNAAVVDPIKPAGLPTNWQATKAQRANSFDSINSIGSWNLLEIRKNGLELVVNYVQGGGCDNARGIFVVETDSKVALVPMYYESGLPCTSNTSLRAPIGLVELSNPLGGRQLLHLKATK